jgi:hypothetical protein
MREIQELKKWCDDGRRLLKLRGVGVPNLKARNNAVAGLLERLKQMPEYKAEYEKLHARYEQLVTAAADAADDKKSGRLPIDARRDIAAGVSHELSTLKYQILELIGGSAKKKEGAERKVESRLNEAVAEYQERSQLLAKNPGIPFPERGALLSRISQDLKALADEAVAQGLPGVAAQFAKQMHGTLTHPSAFPPADDLPPDPNAKQKAEFERQQRERKLLLEERRKLLEANVETLRNALAHLPSQTPERAEVLEVLARAEEDLKFARVDTKDSYRAVLTQATARKGMLKVDGKIKELGLDATGDGSLMEKIATKLDRVIDEMTSEAVLIYMQNNNGIGTSYSAGMSRLIENPAELFKSFPGLKAMVDAEVERFTRNVTEVLESTAKDKQEIASTFFGGKKLKGLKNFTVADSDPHNGGRKVTILEFEAEDGSIHKVVNKPRDVRVDAKFVGKMEVSKEEKERLLKEKRAAERLKRIKTEVAKNYKPGTFSDEQLASMTDEKLAALLAWDAGARHRLENLTDQVAMDIPELKPEDIPGYLEGGSLSEVATSFIRRSIKQRELKKARDAERLKRIKEQFGQQFRPGTFKDEDLAQMSDEQLAGLIWGAGPQHLMRNLTDDVSMAVQEKDIPDPVVAPLPTYKFLPKQPEDGGHPYGWVEFVEHGSAKDCVVSEEQAKNFYRQTGRQAALAMLFGIEDLHQGNMMVSNGQPQLTDLEISFSPKVFQHFPKQFEAFKEKGTPPDNTPMGATMFDSALIRGDQTVHHGNVSVREDRIQRRSAESGEEATNNYVAVARADGQIRTSADGLAREFGAHIQQGFEEILQAFGDPALAKELDKFVESFKGIHVRYHAKATSDQLATRRAQMHTGYADAQQSAVDRSVSSWVKTNPAIAPLGGVIADDLKKRDVAYFTRELGGGDVFHNGTDPVKRDGGKDFFEDDGLEGVRKQFEMLRDRDGPEFFRKLGSTFVQLVNYQAGSYSTMDSNVEVKEQLKSELQGKASA